MRIAAIGGGEIRNRDTSLIDRTIVSLSQKESPNLLFIPTASSDSHSYADSVTDYFNRLGCSVRTLFLTEGSLSKDQVRQIILEADIIYVGGGDTAYMMDVWEQFDVGSALKQAGEKGTVLSGLSAGAICWAAGGHSDSQSFHAETWNYCKVAGLGFIPVILCPHYNEKGREQFDTMMQAETLPGIALENRTALIMDGGRYRILKEDDSVKAFWFTHEQDGTLTKTEIGPGWFTIADGRLIYAAQSHESAVGKIEIRKWTEKDSEKLAEICSRADRAYLSNRLPDPYTADDALFWLKMAEKNEGNQGIFRAILYEGKYVGNISVEKKEDVYAKDAEIGYFILPEFCSRGIATEAVKQICREAFNTLDIIRITGLVYSPNTPSKRVLEKNGFVCEGLMKQAVDKNGNIYDLCIYGKYKPLP